MSILSSRCSVLTAALIGSALALGSTLISKPAFAATATANMTVSATVPATCTITTTDMNFGAYDSTKNSDTLANATITATCSSGTNATVAFDIGLNADGGSQRKLIRSGGTDLLNYDLNESGDTAIWEENNNSIAFSGSPKTLEVEGTIFLGQNVPVGSYSDTVTVIITY